MSQSERRARAPLSRNKSNLLRACAKAVDLFLIGAMSVLIVYPLGPVLGMLYALFADAIRIRGDRSRSLGKRLFGYQVVTQGSFKDLTWRESGVRNMPMGVVTFFLLIPLWGWLMFLLVGVPILMTEFSLMLRRPRGRRLGDSMALTQVERAE